MEELCLDTCLKSEHVVEFKVHRRRSGTRLCASASVSAAESRWKLDGWRETANLAAMSGVGLQPPGRAHAGRPSLEKVSSMARCKNSAPWRKAEHHTKLGQKGGGAKPKLQNNSFILILYLIFFNNTPQTTEIHTLNILGLASK